MAKERIAIFGAGGFGREVKMLIDQINSKTPRWDFVGYYDEGKPKDFPVNDSKVLGGVQDLLREKDLSLVLAIGSPANKREVCEKLSSNPAIRYPVLIHPNVWIGTEGVSIGEGSIITAGNVITVNITIGRHVILNLGCTVGHDSRIGDYCSFMPSVNISGEVEVDDLVYVGTGAKIINQVRIGKSVTVGAGAVVTKSLPEGCTAVGVPAKPLAR